MTKNFSCPDKILWGDFIYLMFPLLLATHTHNKSAACSVVCCARLRLRLLLMQLSLISFNLSWFLFTQFVSKGNLIKMLVGWLVWLLAFFVQPFFIERTQLEFYCSWQKIQITVLRIWEKGIRFCCNYKYSLNFAVALDVLASSRRKDGTNQKSIGGQPFKLCLLIDDILCRLKHCTNVIFKTKWQKKNLELIS